MSSALSLGGLIRRHTSPSRRTDDRRLAASEFVPALERDASPTSRVVASILPALEHATDTATSLNNVSRSIFPLRESPALAGAALDAAFQDHAQASETTRLAADITPSGLLGAESGLTADAAIQDADADKVDASLCLDISTESAEEDVQLAVTTGEDVE
jgi:hypothetical protein